MQWKWKGKVRRQPGVERLSCERWKISKWKTSVEQGIKQNMGEQPRWQTEKREVRQKEGLLMPKHCWRAKIRMQEGRRGETFMKNNAEPKGKSCKWRCIRGERSHQNTVEGSIFAWFLSCAFSKHQFWTLLFFALQQLWLPSNAWLACAGSAVLCCAHWLPSNWQGGATGCPRMQPYPKHPCSTARQEGPSPNLAGVLKILEIIIREKGTQRSPWERKEPDKWFLKGGNSLIHLYHTQTLCDGKWNINMINYSGSQVRLYGQDLEHRKANSYSSVPSWAATSNLV